MEIIVHRINSIEKLKKIKPQYGVEIDVRTVDSKIILNHDPFSNGDELVNYLDEYHHGTIIFNIKEAGIENEILKLVNSRSSVKNYFFLDVEFPYLVQAAKRDEKKLAIRFSEFESIETVKKFINKVNWVWIDTISTIPITSENIDVLDKFNKCLVCPERWGRPYDIANYKLLMKNIGFEPTAVMTNIEYIKQWEE